MLKAGGIGLVGLACWIIEINNWKKNKFFYKTDQKFLRLESYELMCVCASDMSACACASWLQTIPI